jgi:hypothetical protein
MLSGPSLAPPADPPPATTPAPDPCSIAGWYADPPLDAATGKPTGGLGHLGMVGIVEASLAIAGGVLGAFVGGEDHRGAGIAGGALVGALAGVGVNAYQYKQWKDAGGMKHVKGACAAPAATATPDGSTPTVAAY